MTVSFKSAFMPVALTVALSFGVAGAASADALTENFDNGIPANWTVTNLSDPVGTNTWGSGNTELFPAQAGADDSYASVNYLSGGGISNISNWLILPTSTYNNGDTLSFFTRTVEESYNPDTLEVRFSTLGGTDVGTDSNSVGTFGTLLLTINENSDVFGYPSQWTQYSVTLSGLSGATNGAFAFRYTYPAGGENGFNGNYIGIDTVSISGGIPGVSPVPEAETYLMLGAGLGLIGWMRKRKARAARA